MAAEIEVEPGFDDVGEARFAELYAATFPELVDYCRRRLDGVGDPEAVAQEALFRVWRSWSRYDQHRPFWPWAATIARCLCIDERRRRMVRVVEHALGDPDVLGASEPASDDVDAVHERRSAMAAFDVLPEHQRRILLRRALQGWSYTRIAEDEGVSADSVRSSLKRARMTLLTTYERSMTRLGATVPAAWIAALRRRSSDAVERMQPWILPAGFALDRAGAAAVVVVAVVAATLVGGDAARDRDPAPRVAGELARPLDVEALPSPPAGTATGGRRRAADTVDPVAVGPVALPPNGATSPDDAVVSSFTAAGDGRTVFAVGSSRTGCNQPPCSALFRSSDGGASWTRLPAVGFSGGRLLLPQDHPADPRMFAATDAGVLASEDGGATFTTITSVGGPAALVPGFATGDERILIGGAPGWQHNARGGTTTPMVLTPPPAGVQNWLSPSPSYGRDRRLLVGSLAPGLDGSFVPTLSLCLDHSCRTVELFRPFGMAPRVWQSDDGAVALAWAAGELRRSTDRGSTFEPVTLPGVQIVNDVSADGDGVLYLAHTGVGPDGGSVGGVLRSTDLGRSWQPVGDARVLGGVVAIVGVGSGTVIASRPDIAGGGLLCSGDGGASWTVRCGL